MAITELVQWKRGRALEAESVLLEGTGLTAEELKGLFGKMLLIRRFEEAVEQAFRRGQIGGYVHVYIGQEAVATGFLAHRHPGDLVFTGYRDHHHALLLGTDPGAVMAELFGAEIAACISERAFDQLDAPVERVTGADVPMPYARNLELLSVPHEGEVMAAARRTLYLEA